MGCCGFFNRFFASFLIFILLFFVCSFFGGGFFWGGSFVLLFFWKLLVYYPFSMHVRLGLIINVCAFRCQQIKYVSTVFNGLMEIMIF